MATKRKQPDSLDAIREVAKKKHQCLIDLFLGVGMFTERDLSLWQQLRGLESSVRRDGPRAAYLHLQKCDRDQGLLQQYRPVLWARIVAEGQYTPSQRRRMAQKGV